MFYKAIFGAIFVVLISACGPSPAVNSKNLSSVSISSFQCASSTRLTLIEGSTLNWTTIKNLDYVVIGRHDVSGTITLPNGTSILNSIGTVDFNTIDMDSDSQLRDDRIRNYVFKNLGVTLDINGVSATASKHTLPPVGESVPAKLNLTLNVAGKSIPLIVDVNITATRTEYVVNPKGGVVKYDLYQDLNLKSEIDSLMALVPTATMEESIEFNFTLKLQPQCL